MERLLAVWLPAWSEERPDGAALRVLSDAFDALFQICPFVEPLRLGLLVLPVRGPSRFFGGDDALFDVVRSALTRVTDTPIHLGVAEGLFCADLAAQQNIIVAPGETTIFRRRQPIEVLGRRDLTTTCRRLGIHTLGEFAALTPSHVAERFSGPVRVLHRVARGDLPEMSGQRDARIREQLQRLRGEQARAPEQIGFFGQRSAGDDRAHDAAHRVRSRLGDDGVLVAHVQSGRTPDDQAALVPWDAPRGATPNGAPWPGHFGAPAPTTALRHHVSVSLCDDHNVPITLNIRGQLSAPPAVLFVDRTRARAVRWYAGPWPLVERWWGSPRRRAYVQVLLDEGEAFLLTIEGGRWWLTGIYD